MNINMNQECTVVLLDRGVEAINKYYKRLGLEPPKEYKKGDEYTEPLWEIMSVFGRYTYMGPQPPFETTMIFKDL